MKTLEARPMKSLPTLAAIALGLVAAPAAAQQLGANSKAPIDITSDHAEASNSDCVSTWSGNVEALQDNARLRTDVLKLYSTKSARAGGSNNGCGDIDRMEALGSVYYVTPQQRVKGDNAVYQASSDTITVTGDVVAVRGRDVMRGKKMVINVKTGDGQMESDVTGRNKPGRVRGVFYPNDKTDNTQPPAAGQRR